MLATPTEFLIRTHSCLRHYEYVSKTDALIKSVKSTAQIVWESRHIDIKNVENFNYIQEVNAILAWVTQLESTQYELLLKSVCMKSIVLEQDMAVLCSAVIAYKKHVEVESINCKIAAMVTHNQWVGIVGDTISGDGQIIYVDDSIRFKKKTWCVRLLNNIGAMLVYYANVNPNYKPNELIKYNGKIKAHGMINGNIKYTNIVC